MTTSAAQADAFYRELLAGEAAFTIEDGDGIPAPKGSTGRRAMPFWSKRSRAELVIANVPAYSGFSVKEITAHEFRERWLIGLARDGLLVGLNWSGSAATGYDLEPSDVERNLRAREA